MNQLPTVRMHRAGRLRCHEIAHLTTRWERVAGKAGLPIGRLAGASGYQPLYLDSYSRDSTALPLYLSAGIHGDEPAGSEALIEWAEESIGFLQRSRVTIFPCLNPWGLEQNCRFDQRGKDLNRRFHLRTDPLVRSISRLLHGRRYAQAMCLHEDYDGRGVYVYEIPGRRPYCGEQFLSVASRFLPTETRREVEGRPCRNGLIRRAIPQDLFDTEPEALFLHAHHAERTFTLETPSEFSLDARIEAQKAVLKMLAGRSMPPIPEAPDHPVK